MSNTNNTKDKKDRGRSDTIHDKKVKKVSIIWNYEREQSHLYFVFRKL